LNVFPVISSSRKVLISVSCPERSRGDLEVIEIPVFRKSRRQALSACFVGRRVDSITRPTKHM
jgi:hypothetical protein